jgi:hypothetical protein
MSTNPNDERSDEDTIALAAAVGEVTSPDGRTTVRVERSGKFQVVHEWIEEGQEQPKHGEPKHDEPKGGEQREETDGDVRELDIDPDRLFATLDELPSHVEFPNRPGIPDEPIVTFTIESAKGPTVERMWLRDAEKQASGLVSTLKTVVERATDGRRYL